MIIGIVVKIDNKIVENKTFNRYYLIKDYWKKIRKRYKKANFFAYRATHPVIPDMLYNITDSSVRYCPYCEEVRQFLPNFYKGKFCSVCNISIDNSKVKLSNR